MCQKFSGCTWALKDAGFTAPPERGAQGSEQARGRRRGEGITRKKWTTIVWVRLPPCTHRFLCKTVESSEKGPRGRGTASAQTAELLGKQL